MIEIRDIKKRYGQVEALKGVSLDIQDGEMFGLIGPDGSGKTSLFRLMTTLLVADEGTIRVDGLDPVKDYKALRQEIGYMPGRFSLYQDLTVEENLRFFATVFDTTIEANYDLIKDIYCMLEPFKNRRAGKLSGGMKQKLALSCALIHAPKVLFLDEPTTGVDPVSRKELFQMLCKLRDEQGITIVVSTPYRDEVMQCDRIALMKEGAIETVGRPQGVMPEETMVHRSFTGVPDDKSEGAGTKSQDYVIEVEGLTKQFGDFKAVDGITFKVRKGEIFGFLGANGAGKTTAMRILAGLSQPTGGRGTVAGYDCATQYEQIKHHIGYMSQRFSLYDDLTVRENLELFGGIYGMKKADIKTKTETLLQELGFQEVGDKLVKSLPLGWKQKLAFSVSIFHSPEIVFLDEPTGGVDVETRKQFWQLIYQAADRGITVFVTTHYMDEAEYCDRVSIMVDGHVEALDTPARLKAMYKVDSMYEVFLLLARRAIRQ